MIFSSKLSKNVSIKISSLSWFCCKIIAIVFIISRDKMLESKRSSSIKEKSQEPVFTELMKLDTAGLASIANLFTLSFLTRV